ncbi:MAG: hypothetical protein WCJ64_00850 [Rhodospirillaceae bacterium]
MSKIIVTCGKGGGGKSLKSRVLAHEIRDVARRAVFLCDTDPQGSLFMVYRGDDESAPAVSLAPDFLDPSFSRWLDTAVITPACRGADVLCDFGANIDQVFIKWLRERKVSSLLKKHNVEVIFLGFFTSKVESLLLIHGFKSAMPAEQIVGFFNLGSLKHGETFDNITRHPYFSELVETMKTPVFTLPAANHATIEIIDGGEMTFAEALVSDQLGMVEAHELGEYLSECRDVFTRAGVL